MDILTLFLQYSFSTLLPYSKLSVIKANAICMSLNKSILSNGKTISVKILIDINPSIFVYPISLVICYHVDAIAS